MLLDPDAAGAAAAPSSLCPPPRRRSAHLPAPRQAYSHSALWAAIDVLALRRGVTLPRLCEIAIVSPATVRPRCRHDRRTGRPCWPSSGTIARLIAAAGLTYRDFAELVAALEIEPRARAANAAPR